MVMKPVGYLFLSLLLCGVAAAGTLTEDFNAPFPAWESAWLGANSNLENYYVVSGTGSHSDRGNNPDGLWLDDGNGIYGSSTVTIAFNPGFGATLTSFALDIAGHVPITLEIFDASNVNLLSTNVTLTYGALTLPGVYARYSANSSNGIGGFRFIPPPGGSQVEGNTSIDNVVATTQGEGGVPEPGTWVLLGTALLGLRILGLRRRQTS